MLSQRNPSTSANDNTIEAVSANIDDRTIHELYNWPFANAVHAGVSSIMCSYNRYDTDVPNIVGKQPEIDFG